MSSSQIFNAYRAIGFCSNHVPLAVTTQGADAFIVASVGTAFHVYNYEKLRLVFVGSQQPGQLQCLATQGMMVFASYRSVVKAFKRGKEINSYLGHEGEVHILIPFGEHLLSIDDKNVMKVWQCKRKDSELYGELHFDPESFLVTCALHPSTYLNKILLGSRQGELQLWNIRTNKLIYTFPGWGSPVLVLTQSPAVDVVGIGLENGGVVIHNVKYDVVVMRFQQEWGPVVSMSFRTDGINTVSTGSPIGHAAVWDLDKKRLCSIIKNAHNGSVSGLDFLSSQPLLVSSGPDNSVKIWIFDQSDGSARLLRSRCGHSAPPTKVRFTNTAGDAVKIISGGLDNSLRVFGVHKDVHMNMELSQGPVLKRSKVRGVKVESLKLPPIIDFSAETTRGEEWDNVVTCHAGHHDAITWSLNKYTIGQHSLSSKHHGARPACVTVTGCGNYAVIGMSSGNVEVFNIQSGIHRGELGKPRGHDGPVRGVAVDSLNMEVFTGGSDSCVKVWSFHEKTLTASISLGAPVASMVYHRDSCMLAVALDNFTASIIDTGGKKVVRRFKDHKNRITDMTFSPDGRWLVTSAMDCTIRTWDLPTGRLLDVFLVESPATSVAMSLSGDFLASSHVDDLGIYLWSNKTMFSHVSLRPISADSALSLTQLPASKTISADEPSNQPVDRDNDAVVESEYSESSTPLADGLVTLSMLPKSRWSNLLNLDIIKQRNKPIEPPKTPKLAPFFLPTLPGLQPKFLPSEESGDIPVNEVSGGSKILNLGELKPLSEFQKLLQEFNTSNNVSSIIKLLKELPPASIDSEFRSLAPEAGGSLQWLQQLLKLLLEMLKTNQDFELVQSYIGLFLKLYSGVIPESAELAELTEQLLSEHQQVWASIEHDLNVSSCLLSYCKNALL